MTIFELRRHEEELPIVKGVRRADNPLARLVGLMGKAHLAEQEGLWILPCSSIHSCFMRFEFDAVFIDKNNTVVHLIERMKPWRISALIIPKSHSVIELAGGVIAHHQLKIGDRLLLTPKS